MNDSRLQTSIDDAAAGAMAARAVRAAADDARTPIVELLDFGGLPADVIADLDVCREALNTYAVDMDRYISGFEAVCNRLDRLQSNTLEAS